MAQLKYVDWDGLVYYDGKVKQYIDDKMTSCLKMGGHIEFAKLPAPSYNNLNYIYKITDEFTSNEHFVDPGYQFNANTWVQVVDINGLYRYNIFDEADQTTSEILAQLDALDERVTTVETDVVALGASLTGTHTAITELSSSIEVLGQTVDKDREDVEKLDDRIDELQQTVLTVFNDNVATTKQVAQNTASIGSLESDVRELTTTASETNAALAAVTEQCNDNKAQIEDLVGIATTQAERVTLTENRITTVEDKTDAVDSVVTSHAKAIETLNDDILGAANTAASALAKANQNEISIVNLTNDVAENADAIEANTRIIEDAKASYDEAIADIETDIETLSSNLGAAQADIESVESALNEHKIDANGRLVSVETRIARNEADIQSLTSAVDAKADIADIEDLATQDFVTNAIDNIELPSLDGYATESYVDAAVKNVKVDTSDLATKAELTAVEDKIPSLTGYATETYVVNAIAQAQLGGGDNDVDLSGYATKDDLNTLATKEELSNYSTTQEVQTAIDAAVERIELPEVPSVLSAFDNDTNFITIADVEEKGYLTEHQDITGKLDVTTYESDKETFAVKSDLDALATQEYVDTELSQGLANKASVTHSHLVDDIKDLDLGNYTTKDELADAVAAAVGAIEIPAEYVTESELEEKGYLTEHQSLEGYVKSEDIADFITIGDVEAKNYLTKVPAEYITEDELDAKGYLTSHQDLSEYAKLADIPTVPTNVSEFNNDVGYLTQHQDISGKADVGHTHTLADIDDYTSPNLSEYAKGSDVAAALEQKQDTLVSGTNIATINGQSLLSGGNIEVAGGTVSSPDDIYLTFTDPTTIAVGGLAAGTTITNWSLTKLIQTMLFGSNDTPDEPVYETTADQIVAEEPVTYILNESGELVESAYAYKELTSDEATQPSDESYFYQIKDSEGNVIESGFQQDTPYQEENWLTVAVPNYVTNFWVEQYNDDVSDWDKVLWELEAVPTEEQTVEGYTIYRVPEAYEVMSGITIRIVIQE